MGYTRAAFMAGIAIGFIAGARAGRERYDQIVKYSQKAWQSPPVQKASQTASVKAKELSKLAAAQAQAFSKSAAQQAPKTAGSVARKAKAQAGKVNVPSPKRWRNHQEHPEKAAATKASVNGNGRDASTSAD